MEQQLPDRKFIRWYGFDYTNARDYFITIVVHERLNLLGYIQDGIMILNDAGKMIDNIIHGIPQRYPNSEIICYVIMPNHIHFILRNTGEHYLPEMMRWFKSVTTVKYIQGMKEQDWQPFNKTFWQRNYYDHVIRTQKSFDYIVNYIDTNPQHWSEDKFYI